MTPEQAVIMLKELGHDRKQWNSGNMIVMGALATQLFGATDQAALVKVEEAMITLGWIPPEPPPNSGQTGFDLAHINAANAGSVVGGLMMSGSNEPITPAEPHPSELGRDVAGGFIDPYSPAALQFPGGGRWGGSPNQAEYNEEVRRRVAGLPTYAAYWDGKTLKDKYGNVIDYSKPGRFAGE